MNIKLLPDDYFDITSLDLMCESKHFKSYIEITRLVECESIDCSMDSLAIQAFSLKI